MVTKFMRGAKPSPRHILLAADPFRPRAKAAPQFTVVPPRLDMWDNDVDGVCVTTEEAWAKAWWSTYCGLPETFATAAEVRSFAAKHGWIDGATLTEVMDVMVASGMPIGGVAYKDGGYQGVDYSDESVLQAALDPTDGTGGPVKIAIDADALPSGAGNGNGWFDTGSGKYGNTDHCVGLGGYGRADYLYDAIKMPVPSGLAPSTPGYHLFTWSSIGFITHDWLMGTCVEAWVRNPTTPGQSPMPVPVPPSPTPTPGPTPVPVPPSPTPGVIPIFDVAVSGSIPGLFGIVHQVILKGTATPRNSHGFHATHLGVIPWAQIVQAVSVAVPVILADVQAGKSILQIVADVASALAGLQHGLGAIPWAQILAFVQQLFVLLGL